MTTGASAATGAEPGLVEDYSATGAAWQRGPGRVYDRVAERVVREADIDWAGRVVVDVGAGTGAASRALRSAGARPIATDLALGMLAAATGQPRVVADARSLPLARAAVDGYLAAFCLNHLTDPEIALREAARVVRPGGPILATAYAADDAHPVKAAVEAAATELGWRSPAWADAMRTSATPLLATVEGALSVAHRAGLPGPSAVAVAVDLPHLGTSDLVAWRMGMAQLAPFVGRLDAASRASLAARATALLGDGPALVRRIIVLHAVA